MSGAVAETGGGSNERSTAAGALDGLVVRVGRWTVHLWTPDEALHCAIDRTGRLLAGHARGLHLRVGLDTTVVVRPPGRLAPARRLARAEGDGVLRGVAALLREALGVVAAGRATLQVDDPGLTPEAAREAALAVVARAAERAARPEVERAAFERVYRPIRVLPPDCAQALVVQLTEGCSYGRCTFCSLYAGVRFRIKPRGAFLEHVDEVARLFGEGAALRARVFLGDANALLAPVTSVLEALAVVRARFPEAARGGVHAFVDAFTGRGRTIEELRALREAGLGRVTVGLESGHLPLLAWLRKPSTPEAVAGFVHRAKRAGLEVGVTVLVGAGGREFGAAHVQDTARVVRALGLGPRDLVFLSPLVIDDDGEYARRAALAGIEPLDDGALERQAEALRDALSGGPWRVTSYDLRRWVY